MMWQHTPSKKLTLTTLGWSRFVRGKLQPLENSSCTYCVVIEWSSGGTGIFSIPYCYLFHLQFRPIAYDVLGGQESKGVDFVHTRWGRVLWSKT